MAKQKGEDTEQKEHDRAIRNETPDLSAVAVRCLEMGHSTGPCKIIKEVHNSWRLDTWMSLYILNENEFEFAHKTNRRN
jgi:hypothetical protein